MPLAPLVVKLSTGGARNRPSAGGRNASHLRYLATHGAMEANAAHVIYQATHDPLTSRDGQRLVGNAATAGLRAATAEAHANPGHQWRWIVSLRGDEADRLGYDPNRWHDLAKELSPRLGAAAGIAPEQLRWVAAHHDPRPALGQHRHPHLHLAVWSAQPHDRPHRLATEELRQAKRAVAQAIYGPERAQIGQERTVLREAIRRAGAETLGEALTVARELRGRLALPSGPEAELAQKLQQLSAHLPGKGRVALAFMPPPIKGEARRIADWLLQQPALSGHVQNFQARTRELAGYYLTDPTRLAAAELRAHTDLRDRVAQVVLRSAAQLHGRDHQASQTGGAHKAVRNALKATARALQETPRWQQPETSRRKGRDDGRGRDH